MVQKGNVIEIQTPPYTKYLISERLDDFNQGQGGWLAIDIDALKEKGYLGITAFDCWRVSDRYLEVQMKCNAILIKTEQTKL